MNILERLNSFFPKYKGNEKEIELKKEDPVEAITPIYKEISPERNLEKLLEEGVFSWSFMAMNAIAEEIMSMPLRLFKKNGEEIKAHAILNLIDKPNELQTTTQFFWQIIMVYLATGEAPILTNGKNPTNMTLINPNKLKMNFSGGKIDYYEYTQSNGTIMRIENPEELVFLKIPTLINPFRGQGRLKYILKTLDLDDFMEKYLVNFFFNDATPGAVLQTDKELNQGIVDRLKQQFKTKYTGVKNSHKLAILEKGLKWQETSSKISEMQLSDEQNEIRNKILAAFKVPKSILGITEDVNRANGENSDRVFSKRAVKPILVAVEEQLNTFLLPLFAGTENMELVFDDPVKEDQKLKAEIYEIYARNNIMTVDEIREELSLESIETEEEEEEEEEKKVKNSDPIKDLVSELLQAESNKLKKRFTHKEVSNFHDEKIFNSNDIEARYKEKLKSMFRLFGRNIVKQLEVKTKKQLENFNFQSEEQKQITAEISAPFIEEALIRQSSLTYAFLGLQDTFKPQDKFVVDFIKNRTLKLGTSTSKTTRDAVERILRDWTKEEESVADLKKRLKLYFNETKRSDTIARTEVSRASGEATGKIYKDVGAVGKQWITARDERVCEFCRLMDGKIAPINRNFWLKGQTMIGENGGKLSFGFEGIKQFPLHADCRCDLIPIFDKSELKGVNYHKLNKQRLEEIENKKLKEKEIKEKELELKEREREIEIDVKKIDKIYENLDEKRNKRKNK